MKGTMRKVGLFLLVCYTFLLCYLMFFGFGRYTQPEFRYNIIPFSTVKLFLNFNQFNTRIWVINLLGNIGIFVPFGILLPIVFRGRLARLYTKFIATIFLLELTQLLSRRGSFDIDDLLLNSVGFVIGYGIYKVVILWGNSKKVDKDKKDY